MLPLVSVCCMAYNHEKFIKETIESILCQKTDFPFEIIVHDDASIDGTANVIKEYAEKYPDIIKPIIQSENQYSKGIWIFDTYIVPQIKGKYLALCEGDDYWCDQNKLQLQVEWMEAHLDYSLCGHNSIVLNYLTGEKELFNDVFQDRDFSFEEILAGGEKGRTVFHTSSFLYRADNKKMPLAFTVKGIGDYPRLLYLATIGKVHFLSQVMSTYRSNVPGSWTTKNKTDNNRDKKLDEHWHNFRQMLLRVDDATNGYYHDCIQESIRSGDFGQLRRKGNLKVILKEYPDYFAKMRYREKLKLLIKSILPSKTLSFLKKPK